ncbi:MAG: YciI family protein [Bradyrhizobiaceae bacterium]|nr:MAG: YciI family protein [Bradyrhizobiaceae bacterium]
MPYVIETWDKPNGQAARAQHRPAHLTFLAEHAAILLSCGAKLHDDGSDMGGGIYVLDTEDRAEAEAFIAADPFTAGGLFERVSITRQRRAYVGGVCYL